MEIEISGIDVQYTDEGEGEVLVLLPGTMGDENLFRNQQAALKKNYRVVVFDHPQITEFNELLDFYHEVFMKVIGQPFHFGGSSVGGWIAQHYTAKYSSDVKSLILGNTFCDNTLLRDNSLSLYNISKFIPWILFRRFFWKKIREDLSLYPDLLPYFKNNLKKMGKFGLRQRLWWSLAPNNSVTINDIPILLISSDDDPTVPSALTKMLRDRYPSSMKHRFEIGGHFPYLTQAAEYSEVLNTFLQKISQSD